MPTARSDAAMQVTGIIEPAMRVRVWCAIAIGIVAAVFTWVTQRDLQSSGLAPDSLVLWRGARILLAGRNPYDALVWSQFQGSVTDAAAWSTRLEPLYYPLPALLVWVPFALGSFLAGSVAFSAVGGALFAFAVSKAGLHRVWACGSLPFLVALRFGQWSPWLVAASMLPVLAFLLPAKPNLGLPLFLARPSRVMAMAAIGVLAASFGVMPAWPLAWWRAITLDLPNSGAPHPIPLLQFGGAGAIVLLALSRWRRSEARLLVLMACVPQLPFWADQLALTTVATTRREVIWSVLAGHLGFLAWFQFAPKVTLYVPVMQPYALLATYVPALFIVMRRPNAGPVRPWLERLTARLPSWMRGATCDDVAHGE